MPTAMKKVLHVIKYFIKNFRVICGEKMIKSEKLSKEVRKFNLKDTVQKRLKIL